MCEENHLEQINFQQYDQNEISGEYQEEDQIRNNDMYLCDSACIQCPEYQHDYSQNACYEECQPNERYDQSNENMQQMEEETIHHRTNSFGGNTSYMMDDHQANLCPCPQKCRMPMCSPFVRRKYIQPPRQKSCKPIVCYRKPTVPLANETIYKKSFEFIDQNTAACCRIPLIRPKTLLKSPDSPFEKETVTKLSFPPYCMTERTKPIIPQSPSLLGRGPMQGMTTQKHDFVPKFQYRRMKILPRDNIRKLCGCIEKATTQRLSFIPPCVNGKRESCKPVIAYRRPEIPMEFETTQKLSFMPTCPSPREELPWAKKAKYQRPSIGFSKDTVTKLSYLAPGCFIDECSNPCQNQLSYKTSHIDC